jgi:tetratricopeptide (TPR) repeat protein
MFSFSPLARHQICFRFGFVLVTLLFFLATVDGQGVGSSRGLPGGSGRHTIKGRVIGPTGRPYESGLKVRLESDAVGSNSTSTDADGTFIFNNLPAGNYTVVIEAGPDHDSLREPVTIYGTGGGRDAGPQSINVPINLRARGAAAALAKLPKDARDSYNKGMEAAAKGENKKAAELLDKAVTIHPDFPEALSELGGQYMKLGQMDKAAQTYQNLLKLKPTDARAHLNLGIALYNLSSALATEKKLDEAKAKLADSEVHLRESLKLNSSGPTAHYYLGLILIKGKKYPEAQKEIELSLANGGENLALAHKYLGGLYMSAKKNKEAADELEKYLQLDPKAKDGEQIRATIKELRGKQ